MEEWTQRRPEMFGKSDGKFPSLVLVLQEHEVVKIRWAVHFKWVKFTVQKLLFNNGVKHPIRHIRRVCSLHPSPKSFSRQALQLPRKGWQRAMPIQRSGAFHWLPSLSRPLSSSLRNPLTEPHAPAAYTSLTPVSLDVPCNTQHHEARLAFHVSWSRHNPQHLPQESYPCIPACPFSLLEVFKH